MATTYCSYSLVIILDIRDVETTGAIVYGRRAGMSFMVRSNRPGQVLLRDQMPPPVLFLNLNAANASNKEIPEREFNSNRPWAPPEPSQWVGWRSPLPEAEVQVKTSYKQIFDRFLLAIFKNVQEYTSLTLAY